MKKVVLAVPVLALVLGGTTACATKKFVRGEVGQVNNKVDTLSRSLEETQERTQGQRSQDRRSRSEGRRRRSEGCRRRPERRGGRRGGGRGQHPRGRDRKGVQAHRLRSGAERREGQLQVRQGRRCPRTSTPELDQLVQQLKANPNGAYIEIEGHTDNVGDEGHQLQARPRARGEREALPVRDAPGAAPQDQRDQLRRRQAGGRQQDQGRPRAEPSRRHQGARLKRAPVHPRNPASRPGFRGVDFVCTRRRSQSTGGGTLGAVPGWSGIGVHD